MKSYDQALNEIYEKANEQMKEMQRRKQKKKKIFAAVVSVCFILAVALSVGVWMGSDADSPADETLHDNLLQSSENENTAIDRDPIANDMEPSIFPSAWRGMNAVIVKWGEQNGQTWVENYGKSSHYDGKNFSIECVGVNVEFITVFTETMSESLITDIEKIIDKTTYLMIPKFYLEEIKAGDTSLVFLQQIAHIADTDAEGKFLGTYTTVLGAMAGDCLAENKYVPAPIFKIENNKICVPSKAYETRQDNGEYYSYIMNLLHKANEYIKNSSLSITFADGVSVEDLTEIFAFVCKSEG